jgi:predicted ester cyclase
MHGPIRGRDAVKKMMTEFRGAIPDVNFWGVGDLIAEGDYVVGRRDGSGTHAGPAFDALPMGSLPVHSGRKMLFTGTTIFRIEKRQDCRRNRRGRRADCLAAARATPVGKLVGAQRCGLTSRPRGDIFN